MHHSRQMFGPGGPPERGFDDGHGIAPEELVSARFVLALRDENIAEGEPGLRWIAVALRARRFRELVDHHHRHRPELITESEETSLRALPSEWHGAWRFGYEWKP